MPNLSLEQHWTCSGRADLRKGNIAGQQQMGERSEKWDRAALQPPRSVQRAEGIPGMEQTVGWSCSS